MTVSLASRISALTVAAAAVLMTWQPTLAIPVAPGTAAIAAAIA